MMNYSDFTEAYANAPNSVDRISCSAPSCFVGSYAPVTKAVADVPFYVNLSTIQPDPRMATLGTATVRSTALNLKK